MRAWTTRRPLVRVLLFSLVSVLVATVLQVGPMTSPARADQPSIGQCESEGLVIVEVIADGTAIHWICHVELRPNGKIHRHWSVGPIVPGYGRRTVNKASARTDSYTRLNVAIGVGNSGGVGVVAYQLYTGDASANLYRQIQVRLIIVNRTTGGTCLDSNWHGPSAAAAHTTLERFRDLPATCGGAGDYEARGNGRFFSTSLNQWISTGWVNSGLLRLPPPCCISAHARRPQ
jgi:hypothetical protein